MPRNVDFISEAVSPALVAALRATYALPWYGTHGAPHWLRVRENGLQLAKLTGADPVVVELFAVMHDIKRLNGTQSRPEPRSMSRSRERIRRFPAPYSRYAKPMA